LRKTRVYLDLALVGVLAVAVLGSTIALTSRADDDYAFFDPLIDIKYLLDTRYVKDLDDDELQNGAIRGMLEVVGDPYTAYVPGRARGDFEKELLGEYAGIGAQITIRDGWLTIVTPLDDSPAFRAGVMADDRVVEIEGESTMDITGDEAVDRLTGEPGTVVNIVVERDGVRIPIEITRERIKTRSAKGLTRDPEDPDAQEWRYFLDEQRGIAYLRLTQFTPQCSEEIAEALREMGATEGGRVNGLIFDVRWNPGGVLEEAIRIADLFLDDGVIVSTDGRSFPERIVEATVGRETFGDFPIVMLINDTSASASEVLAGALVENDRAIALGTRTFGKGSVQSVINLPSTDDGAQLKLTEQLYYLPSGRSIHRLDDSAEWGVDPTPGFYVPIDDREELELFNARRDKEIIRGGEDLAETEEWSNPTWIIETMRDRQLALALEALQVRIDEGEWRPTGEEGLAGNEIAADALTLSPTQEAERLWRGAERELARSRDDVVALSAALDLGLDLGFTLDFDGQQRNVGSAPDAGAYEKQ